MADISCKRCGATEHVKNGMVRQVQRYRCQKCGCNFTATPPLGKPPAMRALALLCVRLYRGEQDGPLETVIEACVKQQPTRAVLVIEDDLNVGEVVQSGLGPYYQIETALDGEAGLRRWCQRRTPLFC